MSRGGAAGIVIEPGGASTTRGAGARPGAPGPGARALVCAAAGVLYALAQVGYGIWPLVFVCLALWWGALGDSSTLRRAVGLSALFGASAYVVAMPWLFGGATRLLDGRSGLALLLFVVYGAWIAAGFAAVGALVSSGLRVGRPAWLVGPIALVVVEWLQPRLFAATVGESLASVPVLAQGAELGGPLLLSAFVAVVNGLLLEAWRAEGRKATHRVAVALLIVGAAALGGVLRVHFLHEDTGLVGAEHTDRAGAASVGRGGRFLAIGIVQANLSLAEKRDDAGPGHARHLEQTRALLEEGPLDLVVWPETAYARALRRPLPLEGQPIRAELEVPLLFGASSVLTRDGRRAATNSAFLVEADGRIEQVYDKHLLIPFAETDPLARFGAAHSREWLPRGQDFHPGETFDPIRLGPAPIATPICYEVTDAGFVRRLVHEGRASLIVTLANDGWFGRTREPRMHLALARLRAIEHRLWLVRATNSGESAVVDPTGRIVLRTELFESTARRVLVRARPWGTVYGWLGDWPGPLALLALVALGVRDVSRRRAKRPSDLA
ncbi:MAG: apolipoprotein N-acyltransferase [Myxococcota bacterium]